MSAEWKPRALGARGSGGDAEVELRPSFRTRHASAVALLLAIIVVSGCDHDDRHPGDASSGGVYALTVAIVSESGTLATIAVDLEPSLVEGDFVTGRGGRPDCEILASGAFGVFSVLDSDRIRIGVASFVGFDTPVELARCRFNAQERVDVRDFSTELVDAAAPDGAPPRRPPVIELTSVEEEEPVTSTTMLDAPSTTLAAR